MFVGLGGPYWIDDNGNGLVDKDGSGDVVEAERNPDAVGLWAEDVDLAYANLRLLSDFPYQNLLQGKTFYALEGHADTVAIVGSDFLEVEAKNIDFAINDGPLWQGDIGPPAVDFTSFAGGSFDVPVDGTTISIDLDGNQRYGVSVGSATLKISEFVHVTGSFAFEKGPTYLVNIATGFPADISQILNFGLPQSFADAINGLGNKISPDLSTL